MVLRGSFNVAHIRRTDLVVAVMRATLAFILLLVIVAAGVASAQDSWSTTQRLAHAMRAFVTVQTPRGPVAIAHCRNAGPRGPVRAAVDRGETREARHDQRVSDGWARCDARLAAFSRYFISAGRTFDVSPWVLAAMARHESGLNPYATGPIGERGIAQLHPRGVGQRSQFVRSPAFRRACMRQADACQEEVVLIQAEHLRFWIDRCGDLKRALGGYNRGRCGITAYTANVLRQHRRLVDAAAQRTN